MNQKTTVLSFVLPLSVGFASATVPTPMSEDDFDVLMATMHLWRARLVRVDPPLGWEYDEPNQPQPPLSVNHQPTKL